MNRVILIGVSGAGKAEAAAELDGWEVVVVDQIVEAAAARDIGTLVVTEGAASVTQRQCQAAVAALEGFAAARATDRCVVIGPDAAARESVQAAIRQARSDGATVVELWADEQTLSRRLGLNAPRAVGLGPVRALWRAQVQQYRHSWEGLVDEMIDTSLQTPAITAARIVALGQANAVS